MPLDGTLARHTIYITLDARPEDDEYHWGLVITDADTRPTFHHVTNRAGPWVYEEKHEDPGRSLTLIALIRVSSVANHATQVIQDVPASGMPSERTREAFSCRTWVKDTLISLDENGAILLPTDMDNIERLAKKVGRRFAPVCERGEGATVVEDSIFSQ
ncbi:uncharacterized protein B0J16DRAFT_312758 [Fusarium flagelliforme]|uniref:Uncharacterized protein n=1 Tax=Fusarium flagelliforme TaxID=2675880 RepID=A0A395MC70_9HYPO|nr:uncharacterized protein B0J16DRAFT_312758 [Fusarium flagelliforme]KAH7196393.1 hypothetical protein B0J16DRAFT_312758 [Fusarium flagelliforme]RFN45426.1 hypothetical protein FIE12Z_10291 [Fusarium flagelliforme]